MLEKYCIASLKFLTASDTSTITNLFSRRIAIIDSQLSIYLLSFVFSVSCIITPGIAQTYCDLLSAGLHLLIVSFSHSQVIALPSPEN